MCVNPLAPNVSLMDLEQQNLWEKAFWKKDTLSKDAGHWLASFLEISLSLLLADFASANQTRGW